MDLYFQFNIWIVIMWEQQDQRLRVAPNFIGMVMEW